MKTIPVVIKYGGHAMTVPELSRAFARDLTELARGGRSFIVVHGGGPQISSLLKRLNIESRFEQGLRVTDDATMEAVEMVLAGQVNKAVVAQFVQQGVRACGVCGRDASLLHAEVRRPELGNVGEVTKVDPAVLACLMDGGFMPVVAPVAEGPQGRALNVNADTAAGAVAGAPADEGGHRRPQGRRHHHGRHDPQGGRLPQRPRPWLPPRAHPQRLGERGPEALPRGRRAAGHGRRELAPFHL